MNNFDNSDFFGSFSSHTGSASSTEPTTQSFMDSGTSSNNQIYKTSVASSKRDGFQVKYGVWADSLSRGLIDLNISGQAAAGSSSQVDFKSEEVDLFADAAFVSTPTSVAAPGSQVNSSLYFVDLVLNSPAVDVFDKSSSESVREPCQYNYMFVVEAKKVDLTDVGIVGCLSAGTEEKDKGLPNSLHTGRAMGAGSGLGKSTGYSTSTTTDMDDFFSSLSFQK
ncbi:clathrin interactor EPSIN 1 [Tanacetum coccineum]